MPMIAAGKGFLKYNKKQLTKIPSHAKILDGIEPVSMSGTKDAANVIEPKIIDDFKSFEK